MRFFLTGFMGCGKSFWGSRVAASHRIPFIDLDLFIEEQEQKTIPEIFVTKGEMHFRSLEHEFLTQQIKKQQSFLLACGGGTPCFHSNMDLMNEQGVTIYLQASPEYLYRHLKQDISSRPLLKTLSIEVIRGMLDKREKFYTRATHIVDAASLNETIFARIIEQYV